MADSLQKQINDLREWVQRETELRHAAHMQMHTDQERALDIARNSMEHRLQGMNEFREQIDSQAKTFISRETVETMHSYHSQRLASLELSKANLEGRFWILSGLSGVIGAGVVILGIVLSVLR